MREPKGSLLVVDDDADIRSILVEILESVAVKIDTAENGKQALEKILHENYDCVFSDISMPVMTGLELLKEVRKLSVAIPFVMVSAFGDPRNLKEALQLGAMDFIDKPFDSRQIRSVAGQALDYGAKLYEIDSYVENLFKKSNLSPEEKLRIKEMHKQLLGMKATNSVYFKAG